MVVLPDSDILVFDTTVFGSFCSRRSVLADIYKGLECCPANIIIRTFLHQ